MSDNKGSAVLADKKLKCALIMAGGTGGHIFPGLAVAAVLRQRGIAVQWVGTHQGLESRLVTEVGIPLHFITIHGLRGKGWKAWLQAPFKLVKAVYQAMQIIKQVKPNVVIGMGGFVSGPGGIAAWLMRCPLVIHEQNAKAGLTNKVLAFISVKVLQGFPDAFKSNIFKSNIKVLTVGNPVRQAMIQMQPPRERLFREGETLRLLVLGGSLGAQALNAILPLAIAEVSTVCRLEVWHQTGDKHIEHAKKHYESMGIEVKLQPFIKEMDQAYAWADMVIGRAGALTVTELCAVGLGAIFIPFPYAVDDHQTANAQFMVREGAALCIQQRELTATLLADTIKALSMSSQRRIDMAEAAYRLRITNAAEKIVDICEEVCL